MFNPYIIILSLFIVAGLIATIWGWTIIAKGQKTLRWPNVEGIIEESRPASDADDLLPHILFSYTVAAQTYRCTVEFSSGITPTQEFTASYMKRFPTGTKVLVYYDPEQPDHATLEPGPGQGDWLVFALGLGTLIFGIVLLLVSGK